VACFGGLTPVPLSTVPGGEVTRIGNSYGAYQTECLLYVNFLLFTKAYHYGDSLGSEFIFEVTRIGISSSAGLGSEFVGCPLGSGIRPVLRIGEFFL